MNTIFHIVIKDLNVNLSYHLDSKINSKIDEVLKIELDLYEDYKNVESTNDNFLLAEIKHIKGLVINLNLDEVNYSQTKEEYFFDHIFDIDNFADYHYYYFKNMI